jgi:hypothetical protein
MSYALDISNPKILQAMEAQGIEKEELMIKTLDDYGGKNIRDEIKLLRYEFYTRRLEENVKIIKEYLKTYNIRNKPNGKSVSESMPRDALESFDKSSNENKKIFLNEKNKEVLITALEEIKEQITLASKKSRPKSMVQPRNLKLSKLEQLKKNQQENLNKIKHNEEIKVRKALSESYRFVKTAKSGVRNKEFKFLNNYTKKTLSCSESEEEIMQRLKKYEDKLEKSSQLHAKQLDLKIENVRSHQSTAKFDESIMPQNEILFRIIKKSQAASERKEQNLIKNKQKWEKIKYFHENRSKKIKEMELKFTKHMIDKEVSLNQKLNAVEKNIRNRKASLSRDIELKIEHQRLRDEEALIKVKRAQKVM